MSRSFGGTSFTSRSPMYSRPGGDRLEPGDHAQRRALAAPRRADEHDELAVGDIEIHAVHRDVLGPVLIDFADAFERYVGHDALQYALAADLADSQYPKHPLHRSIAVHNDRTLSRSTSSGAPRRRRTRSRARPLADGAGPSIWHRFSHTRRAAPANGDTGDVACDHYRRYQDDVALMRELGLNAYRFSISWSRDPARGTGASTSAGSTSTRASSTRCSTQGITPNATLYHWDLPAALDDRGGWLNRDIADWFADYARDDVRRAGRPRADVGDAQRAVGRHRRRLPARRARARPLAICSRRRSPRTTCCARTARRCRRFRATSGEAAQIGLVVNLEPKYPASRVARRISRRHSAPTRT